MNGGLPSWSTLLQDPRVNARIPDVITDLSLVAEYIVRDQGDEPLRTHILNHLCAAMPAKPPGVHLLLGRLPVREFWTTNYDQLLEAACPDADVIVRDEEVRDLKLHARTILKLHGSVDCSTASWVTPPVMTRTSFEMYELDHPRLWALLRASYLSRTMLFLGFSFTDPNVELLLSLARRYKTSVFDRHFAVLKRPDPETGDKVREHDLRVLDLEASGVRICEIQDYSDHETLLRSLVRRTRPSTHFISGSAGSVSRDDLRKWCLAIAPHIAGETKWKTISLGGDAGWLTTQEVARIRRTEKTYDPEHLALYFRAKNEPAPQLDERVGTAIYTDLTRETLVPRLLEDCRALLAIGGGQRTHEELDWAAERGVGIIPLAASGGAAESYWRCHRDCPPQLGGQPVDLRAWEHLHSDSHESAAKAAMSLLRQAMYSRWAADQLPNV